MVEKVRSTEGGGRGKRDGERLRSTGGRPGRAARSPRPAVAFVTGATSGIGEATARALSAEGYDVVITGRRAERLRQLKAQLEAQYGNDVLPLAFDVRDRVQCETAVDTLPAKFARIAVLVNNAGLALGLDRIHEGQTSQWDQMIDTNIKGLLYITRKVAAKMVEARAGHIINIGSISGTQPYEKGGVYCATKSAVHALSQGMRIDLLPFGIKVTEIRPGMVDTEFSLVRFDGDGGAADEVYEGVTPMTGEDIAGAIVWALAQPAHVNIDEIVLTPVAQANAYYTFRKTRKPSKK